MDSVWTSLTAWDGGLTLLAPLVAIALALATKRVVLSLGLAAVVGSIVAVRGSIPDALFHLADQIRGVVLDGDNLTVATFSVLVAATVGIMGRSGGTRALVARVERLARGRRGAMVSSWLAGGVVFFDDYANCLVVGSAMGPLCDRNRVSRAKLAYIVDATAAPIASLAIVSTWVGYEVGLVRDALAAAGSEQGAFSIFLMALPYRFYCILTLVFVGAIAFSGRDFGPMAEAEAAAMREPAPAPEASGSDARASAWLAAVPVLVLVGVTFASLWVDGWTSLGEAASSSRFFDVIGAADPFRAMLYGSVLAYAASVGMSLATRALRPAEIPTASWSAVSTVLQGLVVLYLAWILGAVIKETGAAQFIAAALHGRLPPAALPAVVFVLAAATSFSTGSSFFTMGALIPLVLPLAVELGGDTAGPVLLASAAAVLDGAVLGDHASPISDTTILSSLGSACDVVTHVRTQLPYALVVGVLALLLGSLPAGFGAPPLLLALVGGAACVGVIYAIGRRPA